MKNDTDLSFIWRWGMKDESISLPLCCRATGEWMTGWDLIVRRSANEQKTKGRSEQPCDRWTWSSSGTESDYGRLSSFSLTSNEWRWKTAVRFVRVRRANLFLLRTSLFLSIIICSFVQSINTLERLNSMFSLAVLIHCTKTTVM